MVWSNAEVCIFSIIVIVKVHWACHDSETEMAGTL